MKKYSLLTIQQKEALEYAIYNEETKSTSFTLKHMNYKAHLWKYKQVEYLIVMDLLKTVKPQRYFIPDDFGDPTFSEIVY